MAELGRVGPYRLIRLLGAGGMGEVFLAQDERLDRKVAIKRLRASSAVPAQHRERFRREARIAARLKHPAIVQIHDVVRDGESDCIVMEYVEGEDLRRRIDAAPLTLHEALTIGRQISQAMAEAHDQGIIHRDLKSENILVNQAGEVKITDFGIAKDLRDETLTADGHVLGTYRAMSPEQALGRPLDHRSDLFSFGVLLYEALTGTSPFRAETPFLTLQLVVHGELPPLRRLQPALPEALAALIEQLLQKDPLLRPRDFHEVADALAEIQGDVPGAPCSGPKPARRPSLDYDGDTLGTEEPGPTPASGNAPAGRSELAAMGTPAASPAAMRDARAVLAIAATEESDRPMLGAPADPATATVPAAPARAARSQAAASGDSAVRVEAPGARPGRVRRYTRRIAILAVAGALMALGLGYQLWKGDRPEHRLTYVAVPPPIIDAPAELGDTSLMAAAVRGGIVRGLSGLEGIVVLPPHDVSAVIEGYTHARERRPNAGEIARAMGADEVIESRLSCAREPCQVWWKRLARDGSTRAAGKLEVSRDDIVGSEQALLAKLHALYRDHARRDRGVEARLTPEDHEAYLRARNTYWADEDNLASDAMLEQLAGIRERAPEFLGVYLLEVAMLQRRFRQRGSDLDRARALVRIREAEKRAPDSYAILATQFDLALKGKAHELARETLRHIEALDPESGWTSLLRGQRHASIGEHEEALAVWQRAAAPDAYWRIQFHLAVLERDRDRLGDARALGRRLLEHSPGNYAGLSLLASVDWRHKNPACAAQLYQELVKRHPYYDECVNLGVVQSLLARDEDAAEGYRCALEARPGDALALFNLAEALKLAGDTQQADQKFRELINFFQAQKSARTGEALQLEIQALAHLAQHEPSLAAEARALMERMLAETPEPPLEDLYVAATAHALLGDEDQAAAYVRVLLDAERPVGWFRFPWFDGVRQRPELEQRLAYEPPAITCIR